MREVSARALFVVVSHRRRWRRRRPRFGERARAPPLVSDHHDAGAAKKRQRARARVRSPLISDNKEAEWRALFFCVETRAHK